MTREQWLQQAIEILKTEVFEPHAYKFNQIQVSVGFPSTKKAIGQWWSPEATEKNFASIFIHPGRGEPVDVLSVLVHELCHDACYHIDKKAGHGPIFKKCALAVGLEGKMRATTAGPELTKYLEELAKRLGKFPHHVMREGAEPPTKKQTTRMVKMECDSCGYIARASLTAISEHGPVICPCNEKAMIVEFPED